MESYSVRGDVKRGLECEGNFGVGGGEERREGKCCFYMGNKMMAS
jgi:hypothetical protein